MSVDTLNDVIEEICDVAGIYGAHGDPEGWEDGACEGRLRGMCRVCAAAYLDRAIRAAVEVERRLAQP